MRAELDAGKLRQFMAALGDRVHGPGTIYLTGGATALPAKQLIRPDALRRHFDEIEPMLNRYPSIDAASFRSAVTNFCDAADRDSGA